MSQKQGHVLSSCNTNDSDWSIVEEAGSFTNGTN